MECCLICSEPFDKRERLRTLCVCGHDTVCSMCYLRVRALRRNFQCMSCKGDLDAVICTDVDGVKFDDFAFWGEFDIGPKYSFDAKSRVFFPKEYYRTHVEQLWLVRCKVCHQSKRDMKALQQHLASEHNMMLCLLCSEHRYVFPSEMRVYSQAEYGAHLKKGDGKGDMGHPLCQFCRKRFYDKSELYMHLSRDHFSCFLCERAGVQYQYFADYHALEDHFRSCHIICEDPACLSKRFVAFANDIDFLAHCRQLHPFATTTQVGSVTLGFHFGSASINSTRRDDRDRRRGRGGDGGDADASYVSSRQQQQQMHQLQHLQASSSAAVGEEELERRRQLYHLHTAAAISSAPLVPANMKVAGRIVGGRFVRDGSDDVLQATAEAGTHATPTAGATHGFPPPPSAVAGDSSFPQLSSKSTSKAQTKAKENGSSAAAEAAKAEAAVAVHPLSLIHQKQREAAMKRAIELEEKAREAELDLRRSQRSKAMADAFGLGGSMTTEAGVTGSAGLGSNRRALLETPLYPPMLVTWAKKYRPDVLKLEKKIAELIADRGANSVQLKPMPPTTRTAAHGVARQMSLNSYEYDYEPKRYISLVKTADTCTPSMLLSAASVTSYPALPASLQSLSAPILFFTRKNPDTPYTVTATDNRAKLKAAETKIGLMTVGDVVSRFQQLLRSEECTRVIVSEAKLVGPSTVALHFTDMTGAVVAAYILGTPNGISAYEGMFTIDRAFDSSMYAHLLAAGGDVPGWKESGPDDSTHPGAFSDHADDDFFGTRGGSRRPLFLSMPAAPKADAISSSSHATCSAPPGLEIDPSIVASLRDEWESILGDDSPNDGKDAAAGTEEASCSKVEHQAVDVETHREPPIDGCSIEDGVEAASKEAPSATVGEPAAPPTVYRRLQLAPRTLPPPLPPMSPRPERPAVYLPGADATLHTKQRAPRPHKSVRAKPTAGTIKPPANAFEMLSADDGDDNAGDDDDEDDGTMKGAEEDKDGKEDRRDGAAVNGNEGEPEKNDESDEDWQLAKALNASESEADRFSSAAVAASSSLTKSSAWSCEMCTLVNEQSDAECKVCSAPRPTSDSMWQIA